MLDTTKEGILSLCGTFLALTTITVALRFVARYKTKAPILVDDWLTVPALVLFIGLASETFYGVHKRYFGYHQPKDKALVAQGHAEIEKLSLSFDALVALAYGCIKLSALFFYRRIFCTKQSRVFNLITWILIAIVAAWSITFFIFPLRMCGPDVTILWRPGASAHCNNVFRYFKGVVISDFLLDVIIIILPIPKIWGLHTTVKRKIAISAVFLLALAGLGASTARMAITLILVLRGRAVDDEDSYQVNTQWFYYGLLECGLTLVAVNLPSLWCFVANAKPERILHSMRSMISLRSTASARGTSTDNAGPVSVPNTKRHTSVHTNHSYTTEVDTTAYTWSGEKTVDPTRRQYEEV